MELPSFPVTEKNNSVSEVINELGKVMRHIAFSWSRTKMQVSLTSNLRYPFERCPVLLPLPSCVRSLCSYSSDHLPLQELVNQSYPNLFKVTLIKAPACKPFRSGLYFNLNGAKKRLLRKFILVSIVVLGRKFFALKEITMARGSRSVSAGIVSTGKTAWRLQMSSPITTMHQFLVAIGEFVRD